MSKFSIAIYRLTYADAAILEYYSKRYEVDTKQVLLTALRQVAAKDKSLQIDELQEALDRVPELQEDDASRQEALDDLSAFKAFRAGKKRTRLHTVTNKSRHSPHEVGKLRCFVTPFDLVLIDAYAKRGGFGRDRVIRHMLRTFALADKNFDTLAFKAHVQAVGKSVPADERKAFHDQAAPYLRERG